MSVPKVELHTLPQADGSASYSFQGYTVIASANGPIEAQRRDEQPQEAFLEVNLRPATGPGSPRDRLLETLLTRTLRPILLLAAHPRSLIQLTLQVISSPESDPSSTAAAHAPTAPAAASASVLPCLPHLLHAALLALLNANIALRTTLTSVLLAQVGETVKIWPTWEESKVATAVHVAAYTPVGECVLMESEAEKGFSVDELGQVMDVVEEACVGELHGWLRGTVVSDVDKAQRWRGQG